jgi:hypothetical protein
LCHERRPRFGNAGHFMRVLFDAVEQCRSNTVGVRIISAVLQMPNKLCGGAAEFAAVIASAFAVEVDTRCKVSGLHLGQRGADRVPCCGEFGNRRFDADRNGVSRSGAIVLVDSRQHGDFRCGLLPLRDWQGAPVHRDWLAKLFNLGAVDWGARGILRQRAGKGMLGSPVLELFESRMVRSVTRLDFNAQIFAIAILRDCRFLCGGKVGELVEVDRAGH